MGTTLWDVTLEQFVKRFVSEDVHIRVSSFKFITSGYDANIVYDGEAAPIYRDKISPDIANLRVQGVEPWIRDTLYIYCE